MRQIRIGLVVIILAVIFIGLNRAGFIFPTQIDLGLIKTSLYGLSIGIAVVAAIWLLETNPKFKALNLVMDSKVLGVIAGGVIGARLFHVISDFHLYQNNLIGILRIFDGGLSLYGAVVGGLLALVLLYRNSSARVVSLLVLYLPLAQMIGRFGNFFNQELFGSPTDLPLGIFIDPSKRPLLNQSANYFEPLFFYEQLFLFCLLVLTSYLFEHEKSNRLISNMFHATWTPLAFYAIGYAVVRLVMEQLRHEPVWILNASFGQVISVIILLIAIFYLVVSGKNPFLRHK